MLHAMAMFLDVNIYEHLYRSSSFGVMPTYKITRYLLHQFVWYRY